MTSGAQAFVQGAFGALQDGKPAIAMQPVKSTNIAAFGFDAPTKTLAVHFANGGMYHYTGVSQELFTELLQATSPGGAFATMVRGKFPGQKIEAKPEPTPAPTTLKPQSAWPFPSLPRD